MVRSTDSRRGRDSDSVMIGGGGRAGGPPPRAPPSSSPPPVGPPARAGPAAARAGGRPPGTRGLRLAVAVRSVRLGPLTPLRVRGFLATQGFRLVVAGFGRGVLVAVPAAAATRPPPAAAPRTRAV